MASVQLSRTAQMRPDGGPAIGASASASVTALTTPAPGAARRAARAPLAVPDDRCSHWARSRVAPLVGADVVDRCALVVVGPVAGQGEEHVVEGRLPHAHVVDLDAGLVEAPHHLGHHPAHVPTGMTTRRPAFS